MIGPGRNRPASRRLNSAARSPSTKQSSWESGLAAETSSSCAASARTSDLLVTPPSGRVRHELRLVETVEGISLILGRPPSPVERPGLPAPADPGVVPGGDVGRADSTGPGEEDAELDR